MPSRSSRARTESRCIMALTGEMLAHVAQERQHAHALGPIQVVHQLGGMGAFEIDEARRLGSDRSDPAFRPRPDHAANARRCAPTDRRSAPSRRQGARWADARPAGTAAASAASRGCPPAGWTQWGRSRRRRREARFPSARPSPGESETWASSPRLFEGMEQRSHRTEFPSSGVDLHRRVAGRRSLRSKLACVVYRFPTEAGPTALGGTALCENPRGSAHQMPSKSAGELHVAPRTRRVKDAPRQRVRRAKGAPGRSSVAAILKRADAT